MNEDAFARRFYADRAELESLGISLQVEKPAEGFFEAELYALPPENYYLPAIEFTDSELAALRTALGLLDGEFAYAEPLRLALQQVSWGRPSPLTEEAEAPIDVKLSAAGAGRELSQRLAKIETAISRRKTIEFSYYSLQRDEVSDRKVDPYHLVFRDGQFYLIGHSHERDEVRVFRLSRIRGKVSYATKAEHDFHAPEDFDRRDYATRADWQMGEIEGRASIFLRERIAWLVERDFGTSRQLPQGDKADGVKGRGLDLRDRVRIGAPADLVGALAGATTRGCSIRRSWPRRPTSASSCCATATRRVRRRRDRRAGRSPRATARARSSNGRSESVIRPERFARLVTLAGLLIGAARGADGPADRPGARRAQHLARGAARGPRRPQRRQLRRRHLRALRRDRRRPDRGRPRHLRRQLRPPGAPAAARGQGAGGGDRPVRRPPAAVGPLRPRARRSSRRSVTTRPRRGSRSPRAATTPRSSAPSTTRSSAHRLLELEYYKENEDEFIKRARSSPTSSSTARRAGISAASTSAARTPATSASTG